jgi:streptogramin lyase
MRSRPTFALTAFALLVSGCSGGQSSSTTPMPIAVSPTPSAAPSGPSEATAQFTITIPNATPVPASRRRRNYVSAATQSIGITTVPQGGSAGPPTIVNVASAACVAGPSSTTCSARVLAPLGTDTFTVTTYDKPNAGGNILSTGTVTGTVTVAQANSFPLILGGVVARIALKATNPYLPAGQPGSTPVSVSAYDADNDQIVGPYTTPISLTAAGGLTLSSSSIPSSSTASITVKYDGASRTVLAIAGSSGKVSANVQIVPTTNVLYYPLTGGGSNAPFQIVRGPDGAYYFGEIIGFINNLTGKTTAPGRIGRIDENGTVTEVQLPDEDPLGLLFVGNDLYFAEQTSSAVGRIRNAGAGGFTAANFSHIIMPKTVPTVAGTHQGVDEPRFLVLGADNNVYVTNYFGDDVAYFDPATFGTGPITEIPSAPQNAQPDAMTLGSNGKFYVTTLNQGIASANVLDTFAPGATSMTPLVPSNAPTDNVPAEYRFITSASDGNLYFTESDFAGLVPGAGGRLTKLNITTGTYTTVPLPSAYAQPDDIEPGPPGSVIFDDLTQNALGVLSTSTLSVTEYPLLTAFDNSDTFPENVALDPDGSYWFTAESLAAASQSTSTTENSMIGHLIFAAGWTLYPAPNTLDVNGLGPAGAQLLGIAGASTAGLTFTATSSNSAICTVAKLAGFADNFLITGIANGTCTVDVTDGTRTVTKLVEVTSNSVIVQTRRRQQP